METTGTILLSLLSGFVGSVLTLWFSNRLENRKAKIDCVRRMIGNRDNLSGSAFCSAVNEVLVVFADSPAVLAAQRDLLQVVATPGKPNINDRLVVLLKEAASAAGLPSKLVPDTAFLQVISRAEKS
ncbi:MAG: hypothetical protein M0P59_14535 [Gallionella sp.]|jgi:hypothetical protein|nr:hypothetical protein [Gallionella sp.]MCK9355349.1 hypothetical protein [Gallionella sp.]